MSIGRISARAAAVLSAASIFVFSAFAQSVAPATPQAPAPVVNSPEVSADGQITFRLLAPQAENVRLTGSDIPGVGGGKPMTKSDKGVWEITVGPIASGSYRYNFNVNGVAVIDPRNPLVSESNNNVWSLVHVPGSDFSDTKN